MLMNLHKKTWQDGLTLEDYHDHCSANEKTLTTMLDLVKGYQKSLEEEEKMTQEQLAIKNVGKMVSIEPDVCDFGQFSDVLSLLPGPKATSRRTGGQIDDVEHQSVFGCDVALCCLQVMVGFVCWCACKNGENFFIF